jgi:hypothetical protein
MGKIDEVMKKHNHLFEDGAEKMFKALKKKSDKKYSNDDKDKLVKKFRGNIKKAQSKSESIVEFLEVKKIQDEKEAIAQLKKKNIKWDKKEVDKKEGDTFFKYKKELVAEYSDAFNLLTIF